MKSIKIKVTLYLTAVIMLLSLVLGVLAVSISRNTVTVEAEKALMSLVEQTEKLVRSRMETQIRILESISKMDEIRSMDWEVQQPVLRSQMEETDFTTLAIVHIDNGEAHYIDGTTADLSDRDYVNKAIAGESNISDIIISRVTNETVLMFAVPIMNGAQAAGVLIGRTDGNTLSMITDDISYGQTGYAYMIDMNGTVVAHKDRDKVLVQWNPIVEAENNIDLDSISYEFDRMITNKIGLGSYIMDGTELTNAYMAIEGTNWIISISAAQKEVLSSIPVMTNAIMLTSLVMIITGMAVSLFLGNAIATPIINLTAILERFAKHDLTFDKNSVALKYLKRKDEIGKITFALEKMQRAITGLIKQAILSSETVGAASQELSASMQEISSNTQNQASNSEELSSSMEEMAANINEVNGNIHVAADDVNALYGTMEDVSKLIENNGKNLNNIDHSLESILSALDTVRHSINDISKRSQDASKEAQGTVNLADEGKRNLDKTVSQMETIQGTIVNLSEVIDGLGESAGQIGDITDLIKDVAEQTNLLALNASIEAARAGEHGKGFAVVAQAIGSLAAESQNAAKEITKVIKNIQAEIGKAITRSEEGTKVVDSGTFLVKETSSSLEKIFEAIQLTSDVIQDITSQMNVQAGDINRVYDSAGEINTKVADLMDTMNREIASAGDIHNKLASLTQMINEISESMEQQSAATDQISTAVNENAAGIEEISYGSEDITRSADDLARTSQELVQQVQQFKI